MSFIDQKAAVRMLVRKKALQIDQRIKKIVVIADDDVAKRLRSSENSNGST